MNATAIQRFLEVLGFGKTKINYHWQVFEGKKRLFYTVVGQRTRPAPQLCRIEDPPSASAA